jgi:lipopolysaccharide/colanic/teichoic acid biosynthesis glycosyltransferase
MNIRRLDDLAQRSLDLLGASLGLMLLFPLLVVVALAIRASDGGPVLHRARRIGRHGAYFELFKFRTMVPNAARHGPAITVGGDRRVTPLGRWLRRTKIDELPQLLNVLRGEMSLVGPRPEDSRYVAQYQPEQRRVLDYRPGMTSAASLDYRHEEQLLVGPNWEQVYREQVMPAKLALDLAYMAQRSVFTDITLIVRTIFVLLK